MQKLMIVEDDPSLGLLYKDEFQDEGYLVLLIESGEQAIERFEEEAVDVVVLDIRLGGMDGLEVLRKMLELRPDVPVILNSAYAGFKTDFTSWSAETYLVKTSDMGELKQAVRRAMARAAA